MTAELAIGGFHAAVARDLAVYVAVMAGTIAALWVAWAVRRPSAGLCGAAITATLVCGVLGGAGLAYRGSIPARLEADLAAHRADPAGAREAFVQRYSPTRTVAHFQRLTLIWSAIAGGGLLAAVVVRRAVVSGVAGALCLACGLTFVLDLSAHVRDRAYFAFWTEGATVVPAAAPER